MAPQRPFSFHRAAGDPRSIRGADRDRQRGCNRNAKGRPMNPSSDYRRLRGPILRSVSRSFYLSLRFLPTALRDPLSLAYLLARATDTIADTAQPPVALRIEALGQWAAAIQGTASIESLDELRNSFSREQSDDAE